MMTTAQRQTWVALTGNTYPVRDQLRAMGCEWDGARKVWMCSRERATQAQRIIAGGTTTTHRATTSQTRTTCCTCHRPVMAGNWINRDGECQMCREERRIGY